MAEPESNEAAKASSANTKILEKCFMKDLSPFLFSYF
jgi:hypothetical protein